MQSPLFPLFVSLAERLCVVVGGGPVAARRTQTLLACGARVQVIAPAISGPFWELVSQGANLRCLEKTIQVADLEGVFLVLVATNDREVNQKVAIWCRDKGIHVNVADAPVESSFVFPATVTRQGICIGVSTSGALPALSSQIRQTIEAALPDWMGNLWELSQKIRPQVLGFQLPEFEKKVLLDAFLDEAWKRRGNWELSEALQWLKSRANAGKDEELP